jgi:NADH-quinone oxidoreductase subunit J
VHRQPKVVLLEIEPALEQRVVRWRVTMNVQQIIFILVAVVTLGAALLVVTVRNLVHAALWLILALFGIAIFFVLLDAGFLAMAQVVIYIGAIAILMIFTIMMTRRVATDPGRQLNSNWGWAIVPSLVIFVGLVWVVSQWTVVTKVAPAIDTSYSLKLLGIALVDPNGYVLPFELASILLVAALIGAILVAREKR